MKQMPAAVADVRREVCGRCPRPCEAYQEGRIQHADPAAACPMPWPGAWGQYGTGEGAPAVRGRPSPVGIWLKIARAVVAVQIWAKAGFPVAAFAVRLERRAICEACPAWRPKGNLGLGECVDPRCGCSRLKRWLATERCPAGKWPERAGKVTLAGLLKALLGAVRRSLRIG